MTIAEVLLKSGWSQEQIDALDAKALSGLNGYVTTVQTEAAQKEKSASELAVKAEADRIAAEASAAASKAAQDAAELSKRSVDEFWQNTYNPGIAAAEADKARLAKEVSDARAEAAFYKAQRESLKDQGIVPADAPTFTPPPAPVVDPNKTPGTPTFSEDQINQRIGSGLSNSVWALQEYQRLTSQFLPDPIDQLAQEATNNKLPFRDYVARKYDFVGKQKAIQEAAAKKHDEEIATTAGAARDAEHKAEIEKLQAEFNAKEKIRAEQGGNNPDVKLPPGSAKFTELKRAVATGERPDPTKMSQQDRRKLTLDNIHKAIEERETVVA